MDSYDPYYPVVRFFFYKLIFFASMNKNFGNLEARITKLDPMFSADNLSTIFLSPTNASYIIGKVLVYHFQKCMIHYFQINGFRATYNFLKSCNVQKGLSV